MILSKGGRRIISNYFYTDYAKKYIPTEKNGRYNVKVVNRDDFRHILRDIFEELSDCIVESDCGVHMEGMGYFYVYMCPKANFVKKAEFGEQNKHASLIHTKGRRYYICFDSTGNHTPFKGMSLDFSAYASINSKLRDKLLEGKRYKFYASSFFTRKSVKKR